MSKCLRTFIAIEFPENIVEEISRIQNELKKINFDVKWVEPQNIHLTLKFLGNTPEEMIERLQEILQKNTSEQPIIPTALTSLDAFFPKIIWVGLNDTDKRIEQWAHHIDGDLENLNFPKENRPFVAHITIGRIRSLKNKELLVKALREIFPNPQNFPINFLTLFKNTLTSQGPIYERIARYGLLSK